MAFLLAPTFCVVRLFMLPLHGIPAELAGNFLFKCFYGLFMVSRSSFPHKLMTLLKYLTFPTEKVPVLSYY